MNKGTKAGLRQLILTGLFASLVLVAACDSGDDGVSGPGPVMFTPSSTPPSPGGVRMGGTPITDERVRVDVEIGGATTGLDIYAFAFDILLSDGAFVRYLPGTAVFGDALELDSSDGQGQSIAVSQQGNRVIVGVTKTGGTTGSAGDDIPAGGSTVVSLTFRINDSGSATLTFAGSPANSQNPTNNAAAINSSEGVVGEVTFDGQSAVISR